MHFSTPYTEVQYAAVLLLKLSIGPLRGSAGGRIRSTVKWRKPSSNNSNGVLISRDSVTNDSGFSNLLASQHLHIDRSYCPFYSGQSSGVSYDVLGLK